MQFDFKHLFGTPAHTIKPVCLLVPFLPRRMAQKLGLSQRFQGKPYAGFQHDRFTVIESRMGALFSGDAVLNLAETPCRRIILIGACGSLDSQRLPIGSLVSPKICYAMESFVDMLEGSITHAKHYESSEITTSDQPSGTQSVTGASIGSIYLENQRRTIFQDLKIDVLDMECAGVFAAAREIQRQVQALLYVTDIIGDSSPYDIADPTAIRHIEAAQDAIMESLLHIPIMPL